MTLTAIALWIWAYRRPILIVAGLLMIAGLVAGIQRTCTSKRINEAIRRADDSANRSIRLEGRREAIRDEADADLDALEAERRKRNENTRQDLDSLRRDCRIFGDCVTGPELDRQADDFRRRNANRR